MKNKVHFGLILTAVIGSLLLAGNAQASQAQMPMNTASQPAGEAGMAATPIGTKQNIPPKEAKAFQKLLKFKRTRILLEQKREASRAGLRTLLQKRRVFWKQQKELFQARVKKIKDERKKRIIERVEQRLNALNQKIVTRMNRLLDRMENLLAKIQSRADEMASNGVNIGSTNETIKNIQADIDSLRSKLTEQAGKSYIPQITDEAGLRIAAGKSYQSLRGDFKNLHDDLIKIKKEIADLLHSLAKLQTE